MLDGLHGRALLLAIGAMAELPSKHDKRILQRPTPRDDYTTPFPLLGRRPKPCRHCRPDLPCLKHAKY